MTSDAVTSGLAVKTAEELPERSARVTHYASSCVTNSGYRRQPLT